MRPEKIAKLELFHGNARQRREMDALVIQAVRERTVAIGLLRGILTDGGLSAPLVEVVGEFLKAMDN